MRNITKLGIGAAMICGGVIATAAPAAAQISFGIGVGPAYRPYPVRPAYPSCYDAYGNYLYSYPYCAAYAPPAYVPPVVQPYYRWDRDWDWRRREAWEHRFDRDRDWDRDGDRDRDRDFARRGREFHGEWGDRDRD